MIGVHTGRSGLAVLDLDRHHEDADGFVSLELGWLGIEPSWEYHTATNEGRHVWYRVPANLDLPQAPNYRGMKGCDRKSGSSYVVVWATEIPDTIVLADAPAWLLDHKDRREAGDAFDGDLDDYLSTLLDGEPSDKVLAAIERIPEDFDHNELIARQMELIRLGAEGKVGVRVALDILRESWTRPPWDDEDHRWEFDNALDSGVKKFGAQSARIAALPQYLNCMDKLGSSSVDLLVGAPRSKAHYFSTIRHLVAQPNLTDGDIASLVWNAPATVISRDWGIDYLFAAIGDARLKAKVPIENPALGLDSGEPKSWDLTLLTDEERAQVDSAPTFVDAYLHWAATKVNVMNEPYHKQNALTLLSMSFGCRVFIPLKTRPMGVNLFQTGLGESSTGKSESIALRDQPMRIMFAADPSFDMGSNPSPEALHEHLLKRDHLPSLFHTDEAAGPLNEFLVKSYQAGVVDRLTSYYEGWVSPMLRRGANSGSNTSAVTSFNMAMFGTPAKVIGLLSRDQFESGFLARFLWCLSADVEPDDSQYEESEATERTVETGDPTVEAFANTLGRRRDVGGPGIPILTDVTALSRMSENRKRMAEALADHEQWSILQPSVRRLGDNVRKIATLLAVSSGSDRVGLHHTLSALELAEEFLSNLESVATQVSASAFERNCDEVVAFIASQGGGCTSTRVFHRFRSWDLKDVMQAIEALVQQGRVKRFEETAQRGARLELNLEREEE